MPANHMASLNLREYFPRALPQAPPLLVPSAALQRSQQPWNTPSYLHHDETTL